MPYIQHSPDDVKHMLETIGVASLDEFFAGIPEKHRLERPLDLPRASGERPRRFLPFRARREMTR